MPDAEQGVLFLDGYMILWRFKYKYVGGYERKTWK